tara:strand:- start:4 stop:276 length:273 start_codon:yes stop_codon:yes gene_type:complete
MFASCSDFAASNFCTNSSSAKSKASLAAFDARFSVLARSLACFLAILAFFLSSLMFSSSFNLSNAACVSLKKRKKRIKSCQYFEISVKKF